MKKEEHVEEPVEIPAAALSPAALDGVIKDFIFREGTDYGEYEFSLEQKIDAVKRQLESGKAAIMWDEISESCTLVVRAGGK